MSWAALGTLWAPLDLLGHALGTPWGPLGRLGIVLGRLGLSWGRLEPSGAILGRLGAVLGRLGAVLGPSWGSSTPLEDRAPGRLLVHPRPMKMMTVTHFEF